MMAPPVLGSTMATPHLPNPVALKVWLPDGSDTTAVTVHESEGAMHVRPWEYTSVEPRLTWSATFSVKVMRQPTVVVTRRWVGSTCATRVMTEQSALPSGGAIEA